MVFAVAFNERKPASRFGIENSMWPPSSILHYVRLLRVSEFEEPVIKKKKKKSYLKCLAIYTWPGL